MRQNTLRRQPYADRRFACYFFILPNFTEGGSVKMAEKRRFYTSSFRKIGQNQKFKNRLYKFLDITARKVCANF